jgi:hypothetical protein
VEEGGRGGGRGGGEEGEESLTCRLAETHLVGEDAVQAVVVQRDEPLDALDLVVPHLHGHQR